MKNDSSAFFRRMQQKDFSLTNNRTCLALMEDHSLHVGKKAGIKIDNIYFHIFIFDLKRRPFELEE